MQWIVDVDIHQWVVRDGSGGEWSETARWSDVATVIALLGKVLDEEVAEHHVLAAHGEGIFEDWSGTSDDWAQRLVVMLEHADRIRTIIAEWPPGYQMLSRTELKSRAWNDDLIGRLLEPAAILENPHYASAAPMVLFDTRRVFDAERSREWLEATARLRARRIVRWYRPEATRAQRKRAGEVAALYPDEHGQQLAAIATNVDAEPEAVRLVALDNLERYWWDRGWSVGDLDDPVLAGQAALLGGDEVVAAAMRHRDPDLVRIASVRMLEALAS